MRLIDVIDIEAFKEDGVIKLQKSSIACPECGVMYGAYEISVISDLGCCFNCTKKGNR